MKALTHLSAGGAAGAGLALVVGLPMGWETALVAGAIGAAVPELEYAFFRLAREMRARERGGPWHGLEILVLVGGLVGLAGWLLGTAGFLLAYLAFLGGWLSHLLLDLVNGGIRPLAIIWPYRWAYFPPWGQRRVVRGGLVEALILLGTGWVWVWRLVALVLPWAQGLLEQWL